MESQLPVNNSPQPEETIGAVLLKTLRELLPIFLAEIVLTGVMLGIYALCGSCKKPILLGAALGGGVSPARARIPRWSPHSAWPRRYSA